MGLQPLRKIFPDYFCFTRTTVIFAKPSGNDGGFSFAAMRRMSSLVSMAISDSGNKPAGKVSVLSPGAVTNKKTNAFNKTDQEACEWVVQSAIISLHQAAKNAAANAVTNIVSFYKSNERKDAKTYECHAGAIMAGVALKGDLVTVQ